jgi:hypothetical protein
MPYRRDYGESDRVVVERPASGRATHSAAAALAGMQRDPLGAWLRAAGEQSQNFGGHPRLERDVLRLAPQPVAFTAPPTSVLVPETLLLG